MKEDDINMYDDSYWPPRNILKREFSKLAVLEVITLEESDNLINLVETKDQDNFKIAREAYRTLSKDHHEQLRNLSEEIINVTEKINAFNMICNDNYKLYQIHDVLNK